MSIVSFEQIRAWIESGSIVKFSVTLENNVVSTMYHRCPENKTAMDNGAEMDNGTAMDMREVNLDFNPYLSFHDAWPWGLEQKAQAKICTCFDTSKKTNDEDDR